MSPEKIEYFRQVRAKAAKVEQFICEEATKMGFALTRAQAATFAAIVRQAYGDNTPPAPVDADENIGS